MSFDPDFADMMADPITVEPFGGMDSHGSRVPYGTAKTVLGRIEQQAKAVKDPTTGRETMSRTQLFLRPTASDGTALALTEKDRFTLPIGYSPRQPQAISVSRLNDESGLHHWEVAL